MERLLWVTFRLLLGLAIGWMVWLMGLALLFPLGLCGYLWLGWRTVVLGHELWRDWPIVHRGHFWQLLLAATFFAVVTVWLVGWEDLFAMFGVAGFWLLALLLVLTGLRLRQEIARIRWKEKYERSR